MQMILSGRRNPGVLMKTTQRKDAVRNIRSKIVSYLSICLVIMLGLGGMLSTRYMCAGILDKGMEYYNERNFEDFEFISSMGISEANLKKIAGVDGVTAVEGIMQADGTITFGDNKRSAVIMTLPDTVSVPELTEGRFPSGAGECVVGEDFAEVYGLKVGDEVSLSLTGLDMDDPLVQHSCTITGLMHHPNYLERKVTMTVCLPEEAFDNKVTKGLYTRAYVKIEQPEGIHIISDDYFDATEETRNTLNALADELAEDRAQEMKDEANALIDEEWEKALEELDAAQREIDAGEDELYVRLADAVAELKEAEDTLAGEKAKAQKKIRKAEVLLAAAEKKLKDGKDEYNSKEKQYNAAVRKFKEMFGGDLDKALDELNKINALLDKIDKILADFENQTGVTDEEIDAALREPLKELGDWVIGHKDLLRNIFDFIGDKETIDIVGRIDKAAGTNISKFVKALNDFGYDQLMTIAEKMVNGELTVSEYRSFRKQIEDAISMIGQFKAAAVQLTDAEKQIKDGEDELKKKKAELRDAKKKLAAETAKAQKKLDAGWNQYYAEKNRYEGKLEEAKALLAENREEAEKALAEARAKVDTIECNWILLDRRTNGGYVSLGNNMDAIRAAGVIFGLLFLLITAIVCFSTLTIIIEEQKPLVGTVKAFGFLRSEILKKYMVFGVSAALMGGILGVALSVGLSDFIQTKFTESGLYQMSKARSTVVLPSTILACSGMVAVCALATVIACSSILKTAASVLMKGGGSTGGSRRQLSSRRGGSLYSRLIIRNMLNDKARVIVSIAVIGFSCLLMGSGISMKLAFGGMTDRQLEEIYKYDIRMDILQDASAKDIAKVYKILDQERVSYLPAAYETHLYRSNGSLNAFYLLCADGPLDDYFATKTRDGEPVALPEDGILVQHRMDESYGISPGTSLTILDSALNGHETEVAGTFYNYVGRVGITSGEAYKKIFGKDYEPNCCYIKLNGADGQALKNKLMSVTDEISFEDAEQFRSKYDGASSLYDIIVIVTTGIAILMSFMILTNLANIFMSRKKTELIVMRINGFSIGQTIGYLARETIITTLLGTLLGVVCGYFTTPALVSRMMQPDLQFYNVFHVKAWVIAVILEFTFSLVINGIVFSKVKKLNLRDIA